MSNNVEAIYPLSPMQEGMLFHTVYAPGTGVYVNQVAYTFGGLDADAFRRAWQAALDRHAALRSAFLWEKRDRPLQAVLREVELPWDERDWCGLDRQAQQAALEALMREDRERGYTLSRPPATRLYVMRTADDEHRVLWSFHHLVLDGWSMSLLLGEVFRLYDALRRGESPALPPAPQYRAYITWLQAQPPEAAEAFWRAALDGVTAPTPLGIDRDGEAVPAEAPERYGSRLETIDAALAAEVQAFARRNRVTTNAVVQGAWALLLSRYSGESDVVFGVTVSGRPPAVPDAEQTVGLFINTIVCRVPVRDGLPVGEWLQEIQARHGAAQQHDHTPLVQVQGWSQVARDQPLFESVLVFQNFPTQGTGRERGGLEVREVKVAESTSVPLSVVVGIGEASFLKLMFDRTRIGDAAADRLLGHLPAALAAIVADSGRRVGELELLEAEERTALVDGFNRTARDYPAPRCVHELVEAQVDRTPDAPALVHGTRTVTYRELDAEANRIARHLRSLGVGPETPVGVCATRTPSLIASLLGVMKAGGAYLPLDPAYPAERLAFMLEDAKAPVVLTEEAFIGPLSVDGTRVVCLDRDAAELAAHSTERIESGTGPRNLAYFIYTSGSTGRPKGVMIEHASVSTLVHWAAETFPPEARATVLACTSVCFDLSVFEIFASLSLGSRVVLADNALHFPTLPAAGEVTLLNTVPSAGMELLRAGLIPPLVRTVCLAGEPLKRSLADGLYAAGVKEVWNLYGPSEDTTYSTQEKVRPGETRETPIGIPLANTRGYVLDAAGRLAPQGVPGELFLAGEGLSRGYLRRPSLTAERFVPDPFSGVPGGRMYSTGDRARWLPDGRLEFLGRLDHQVKIRGFRIEMGEVEAALASHPAVQDVVVMTRDGADGAPRLLAWVASGDATLTGAALAEHAGVRLPGYMVPAAIVVMPELPLSPNGKVDRNALPEPGAEAAAARVAPRNALEAGVATLFGEMLSVPDVGATDSFFALGGHSLLAMRLVSRLRERFGVELPLRALFEAPTVAEMARAVEDERRRELPVLPPVVPTGRTGALPLSFAQERLWFIDRMEPGTAVYNMPVAWRLGGALDEAALERALGEIVRRHESLRTVFAEADGSPVQVIAPSGGFALPVEDLSGSSEADREAALRRRAGEEAARAFDLAAGPLFRASLLRLGTEDHVLLLSMHHIVSDGWSMGVLYRELSALYEAYREGGESPLPELAVQYADYAVWQREQLQGEALDRRLAYWRDQLAGAPELLELPTDHPRPAVQTFRGAHEQIELPLELLERLQALGRSEGATLNMTLLGAFQVLLSKYSGSEDIVVGSPAAGRASKEVEELIGFFVNTLVLRTDLSGDPSFREVLRRAREVTLGAYDHQEVPFERLVAELQPERSLSHSPLVQVMFALQNAVDRGGTLAGLEVSEVGAELANAKFDLFLMLKATPQGLRVGLNYSSDLFERSTVHRMLGHLARVLEQVAADADVRLSRLEVLGNAERARLLALGEGAAPDFPRATVDALFAQAAAAAPRAVALAWDGGRMTYAELDERANRLAHHLRRAGVTAETRVGVCLERGPEMVVATLAALKAGGAYVPLDPAYPAERLAFMLADTSVPVLVTESPLADRLPPHAARIVRVDADVAAIAAESADAPAAGTDPGAAAYVMYTSGSTGRPKGVEVPHRAIVRLVRGQDYVSIDPSDVFLQLAPASFDAATLELWGPLLNGACLAIHPAEQPSVESIGRALAEHGVTVLWLTAGLFHLVVEERIQILRGVRQLLAGGDVLSVPHVRRVLAELPGTALINGYGPTENTTFTCCHRIGAAPPEGASIPVGRPIANTYVRVLDAGMQPVPMGVPGELYAGGAGLALGYLNQPELTAEKFVADPFVPGARLYRTGDRVRWRSDGTIEFLGRVDTQVKIRGFRVEPGEVEAVLRAWSGVREAAVVVREDTPGDRRLVAYVAGEVAADELREHLRGRLPEHMLPGAMVRLDALPLTSNGKLDRRALPAPEYASAEERYVAPRTPVEEVLAGIWAEVLRLERVGVEESFFELGGHSLLATRVVSRVRELFGVELPLRALFEGPTVAEMASAVEDERRRGLPVLPPVVPVERTGAAPLSFAQERLWFIDRLEPGSAAYNVPLAWRLGGALDEAALERSLREIVRRHETLRTRFTELGGAPAQVIAPFRGFSLPVEDLSGLGEETREAALRRRAGEEARRAFDLSAGPLFRAALLRLGAEDHVLLLSMHHIVSDGWSMGVLFRELSALYEAYREGGESPLPELPVQYADYAVWQREQLQGNALDRQLSYWRERLAGAPELLELPTDRPRPPVQTYRGATVPVELPPELLERLQALGRSEGATLYMTLLGAFQVLLSKYSGSEDVVVGSPNAGRTRKEIEELIGFFVNTLVLRTDLSGDPSFREVLRRAREVTLGAYEHQDVPFERLVAELQPERSLRHPPLFQVMFTVQDAGGGAGALPGLEVSRVGAELTSAKFDLSLVLTATAHGLRGGLNYSTDLFERGTVVRMLDHLGRVLEQVAADADVRLSELELLGEAERALVLEAWNRTAAEYPADRCIHELFEVQAARTPGAVAATGGAITLTYAEMNARANRLARHLVRLGVGPEARVGVCLERGPELMVCTLAVLKAGGAYVAMDPAYPPMRLELMLRDSGAAVLLTDGRGAAPAEQDGVHVVRVDRDAHAFAAESASDLPDRVSPRNVAYVVYTSGSTGTPKGVAVDHASLGALCAWHVRAFGVTAADRGTQMASPGFDAAVWEVWPYLTHGASVHAVPDEVRVDPPALRDWLVEHAVTVSFMPTPVAEPMLALEWPADTGLRWLLTGGDRLRARPGAGMPFTLVNNYGPTECTVVATSGAVSADGARAPSIGRPIENTRVHVLDAGLRPLPAGVPGELCIGGAQVARGYLNRPALTAERFVPDPFGAEPGARMYRSGDRVRWLPNGTVEYLDRLDEQVKVRGFRIELGEIEAALRQAPAVADCAVVAREDETGDRRLVAYIVGEAEPEALRERLRRSLPEYMVPSALVFLDTLPLTPNGKVDRRALPAPEYAADAERYVAPRTPVEEVLAGIWTQVLRVERAGVHDSFFDLGGHSLMATRLLAHIQTTFGLEISIRDVFSMPTLEAMAGEIERRIYEDIAAISDDEAEHLLAANLVAG